MATEGMSDRLFSLQLRAHSQDGLLKIPVNKATNLVCLTPRSSFSPVHHLSINPTHLYYVLNGKANFSPYILCFNI